MWIRRAFLISFYTLSIGGLVWFEFAIASKQRWSFSKVLYQQDSQICQFCTRKHENRDIFCKKNGNRGCFTVHCQFLCNHAFLNSANYTVLHERWSWCSWQIPRRLQGYSQFDQGLGIVWSKFEPNLFTTCPSSFDDKSTQHPSPRLKMIFFQTRPVRPFAWPGSIHF